MWEIIVACYASGVAIAMWRIWLPSYKIISRIEPNNIMARTPILSGLVVFVIFTVCFPMIAWIILFDDKIKRFQNGFIKGVMNLNDR